MKKKSQENYPTRLTFEHICPCYGSAARKRCPPARQHSRDRRRVKIKPPGRCTGRRRPRPPPKCKRRTIPRLPSAERPPSFTWARAGRTPVRDVGRAGGGWRLGSPAPAGPSVYPVAGMRARVPFLLLNTTGRWHCVALPRRRTGRSRAVAGRRAQIAGAVLY